MSNRESGVIPKIIMGTFDPETRWRDSNLTRLPAMPDKDREAIVLCMDELLFPLCGPHDVLYSRCRIDPALYEYLNGLNFSFQTRYFYDLCNEKMPLPAPDIFKQCMFRLAADQSQNFTSENRVLQTAGSDYLENTVLPGSTSLTKHTGDLHHTQSKDVVVSTHAMHILSPYAITADTLDYLRTAEPFGPLPDFETVVQVNSKLYSNQLLTRIGEKSYSIEANSAAEIEATGNILLRRGPYLLKDPFGVSGKGNLLIESETMQRIVAKHLLAQESGGLRTQFLLEPLLLKETDFSSHWFIQEDGKTEFISVQRMMNHQQNYSGSIKADEDLIRFLEDSNYFSVMDKALQLLAEDGYHGFVCFDSMILMDGEIVPIVEINARKSMGLINSFLDKHWEPYGQTGWLTFLSLGLPEGFTIEKLLQTLGNSGLLVTAPGDYGIVPLSSNTVMVNEIINRRRVAEGVQPKRGMPKGRLYVSVLGRDDGHRSELVESLRQVLGDMSVKVYN